MTIFDVSAIYNGSDADATRALYAALEAIGPAGKIAMNLLRAHKASVRAKKYRGGNGRGSYRRQAYDKKRWSIEQMIDALRDHADDLGIVWGWGRDEKAINFEDVLYVECGEQVSFHMDIRLDGPDYLRPWDGLKGVGDRRVIRYAEKVLGIKSKENEDVTTTRTEGIAASSDAGGPVQPEGRQESLDL